MAGSSQDEATSLRITICRGGQHEQNALLHSTALVEIKGRQPQMGQNDTLGGLPRDLHRGNDRNVAGRTRRRTAWC